MKPHLSPLLAAALLVGIVSPVSAFVVEQGERLEIRFHLPASDNPELLLYPTDTVALGIPVDGTSGATWAVADLYNGNQLLGHAVSAGGQPFSFYWTDAGSNFQYPPATQINGASLLNRSIDGRILIQFDQTYNIESVDLTVGGAVPRAVVSHALVIDSLTVSAAVPEPTQAALLVAGLITIASLRIGRRGKR